MPSNITDKTTIRLALSILGKFERNQLKIKAVALITFKNVHFDLKIVGVNNDVHKRLPNVFGVEHITFFLNWSLSRPVKLVYLTKFPFYTSCENA